MPLHRRLPKFKGFSNLRFKTTYQVVNVDRLAALYPDGGDVTPEDLAAKGAVRAGELVKVLGSGDGGPEGAAGERARVLRHGQGEDNRRRRHRHRAVTCRRRRHRAGDRAGARPRLAPGLAHGFLERPGQARLRPGSSLPASGHPP